MPSKELMASAVDSAFTAQVEVIFKNLAALKITDEYWSHYVLGFRIACAAHERALKLINDN